MRITVIMVFVSITATQLLSAAGLYGQVLDKKVNLSYGRTNAYAVIKDIQRSENIDFAFTNNLGLEKIILENLHVNQIRLADLLKKLLSGSRIAYEEKSGMVTLYSVQVPGKIVGSVSNSTGVPLTGAKIRVVETNRSYGADAEGKFSISLQPGQYTVEISYISFATHRAKVRVEEGKQVSLSVVLQDATDELGEVVVVGYGTQQRSKVTGAISQLKSNELEKYNGAGFAQQLAGKVSGVLINEPNGMPGADPQIVIRGVSTLTAGTKPLIVVDGFPLTEGSSLSSINPKDIETIDILKDPASASIYGSRAANGVIMVTTKKAQGDKRTVNFDVYTGIQQRADNFKLIDAYQAAVYFTEARDQAYISKNPNRSILDDHATRIAKGASKRDLRLNYIQPYLDNTPGLTNTDWLDEIFRTAPMSSYTLSVSGRTGEKTDYYVSGNYFDQKGIVLGSDLKRYSSTLKLNTKLGERVNFGVNIVPSFSSRNYHNEIGTARGNFPFFSPYNEDGSLAVSTQIKANTPEDGALNESSVALTEMVTKKRKDFRTFGHSFLEVNILKGLAFKTMLGGDFATTFDDYFNPSNVGAYRTAAPKPAAATERQSQMWNYLTENTLTYDKQFGAHHFNVLGGYSYQEETSNQTTVSGTGIPDDNLQNIAGASNFSVVPSRYVWTQVSYWTRLQYDYKNRYLLTATYRRDGSSRFGRDSKWGNFPSVSAGWIISNEDFMTSGNSAIDFLKLRASWGMAGNNQVGSYSSQALLSVENYVYGESLAPGYYASSAPNPRLSWETQKAWNLGLDLSVFKHISLGINYYDTRTSDLLLNVPVPEQSGYSSSMQNIGEIQNKGIELDLGATGIKLGQVNWTFNANISTNSNKVLSLAEGQNQIISGNFRTRVGGPIAELYGYNLLGIYKSQEAIDQSPHISGTRVGDNIVEDTNGDGTITPADRVGLGTYAPKLMYGFQSTFSYKGLEFSFGLNGVEGRKVYDGNLAGHENGEAFVLATDYYFKNRYHPVNNPNGSLPQPTTSFSQNRLQTGWASSLHYVDADFLRVRHLQLAYNLPTSLLEKFKVSNLRVYLLANNPFTWTPYRGFNPEGTTDNVLQSGSAGNDYPVARSFSLGINLTF